MINNASPRQCGIRRFLSLINLAAVTAVMLAASGCHKDSFDLDESTRPTEATSDDGQSPPSTRTPNIGIFSPATVQEGREVVVRVTSDANAPEDGLSVTVDITGADPDEIQPNADCTNFPRCIVTILAGNRGGNLTLTPLSDFSTETGERWMATLVDDEDNDYNLAAGNDNAAFDIVDLFAAIGIMASDMPIEGGAVTLTITSDQTVPATLTGGLTVTINIGGADAAEFTADTTVCTDLVCIVTIPAGSDSVNLTLSPLSDFSTETESWTASLVDGNDYDRAANFEVDFAITDLIAAIGIVASDMPIEGGAVTLIIMSDETVPATLIGGLNVTVDISRADAAEFDADAAVCTNLVCIVNIPAGSNSVSLTLSPLSDFSTETESWRASLRVGSNFNLAAGGNVDFAITDLIAAIGIVASDMPIEGGAVTLIIMSDETVPATLIGGLNVTVDISRADAAEFDADAAVCTNLVCIVNIPAGSDSVSLTLSPLSDFSTETESWRASLRVGSNYDRAANFEVDFAITDLIAAIGIATSNTEIIEGGAVTLTITSTLPAPAAGLNVTISIGGMGVVAADFTSAACTGLECVIVIPSGMTAATLTIMASTDSDAEGGSETWTATIAPDTDIFTVDSNADIAVANMLPMPANRRTLEELNAYNVPMPLGQNAIRAGSDNLGMGVNITGFLYNDGADPPQPQIYVQLLTHAHLGIWTSGQVPTVISLATATASDFDHDFRYGFLNDNAIPESNLPDNGLANYAIEGDATYKGLNFFPDGSLVMNFGERTFTANIVAEGTSGLNNFGPTTPMVPDVDDRDLDDNRDELRATDSTDNLEISLDGDITGDGFSSAPTVTDATGFFADLASGTTGTLAGRFYDVEGYMPGVPAMPGGTPEDPSEIAGAGMITDSDGTGNLHFGFLGRCSSACPWTESQP